MRYLVLYEKMNGCYGAKYFTLFCIGKHQGVRKFDTNSKTSPISTSLRYFICRNVHLILMVLLMLSMTFTFCSNVALVT